MSAATAIPDEVTQAPETAPARDGAPAAVRIAYLLSQYPAVSHTFFLNEILGLRALGGEIETASINPPDRLAASLPGNEAAEAAHTLYIKSGGKLQMVSRLIAACLASPPALARGLSATLAIPGLTLRKRLLWLFYLAEAMLLGHWMRQRSLHHLHVHFGGPAASVGMLTAKAWQVPFSLTIHGPEELLNHEAYHLREKLTAARFVIAISDFCRSQLCQITAPSEWSKFHVVRLGVNPAVLQQTRSTAAVADHPQQQPIELVCTGRMAPQKGHRILLEAIRLLRDRGCALHATIVGGGAELTALEHYVTVNDLTQNVTLTGALSHAETLARVARADIFALASFGEGIPVALMEAMAMSIPCVSTTVAGIPELIANGVDGLLVPPANASAFADALETLMLNASLRQQLGQAARQRIVRQYNLPCNLDLLASTFARELAKDPTHPEGRMV